MNFIKNFENRRCGKDYTIVKVKMEIMESEEHHE